MLAAAYFIYLLFRMHNLEDDVYKSQEMVNLYDKPWLEEMIISNFTFLPSIDMKLVDDSSTIVNKLM